MKFDKAFAILFWPTILVCGIILSNYLGYFDK